MIASLTNLTSVGLLPRIKLWDVFTATRGFVCHPNTWIRQGEHRHHFGLWPSSFAGAAGFIAAAAKRLPQSDVWCILYPKLRPLLHCDLLELDDNSILSSVLEPVSGAA